MWQVSGRSDITDFEEVVKLDMQKVEFQRHILYADNGKLMVTGVGGLGKTVVVQQFLNKLQNTPTEESQIEKIAYPVFSCELQ